MHPLEISLIEAIVLLHGRMFPAQSVDIVLPRGSLLLEEGRVLEEYA